MLAKTSFRSGTRQRPSSSVNRGAQSIARAFRRMPHLESTAHPHFIESSQERILFAAKSFYKYGKFKNGDRPFFNFQENGIRIRRDRSQLHGWTTSPWRCARNLKLATNVSTNPDSLIPLSDFE